MVSNTSIIFMVISAIVSFLLPIAAFIYLRKIAGATFKPVIIGVVTFILFSQVLEKLLHYIVITNKLFPNQIVFTVYGALAAGIFEEVGRFIMYNSFLKNSRQWKDGVAFGIGHGGIEAFLLGGIGFVNFVVYSQMINSSTFEQIASKLPTDAVEGIKSILMSPSYTFLLGGIERICAFIMQLGLSILVLYAIRERKNIYLMLAVLLHALMDFPAALYQMKFIGNIILVEVFIIIMASIAMVYVVKSKEIFMKNKQ